MKSCRKIVTSCRNSFTTGLAAYFLAFSFILTSCKDNDAPTGAAPTIPPSTTFEMNFDQLPSDNGGRIGTSGKTNAKTNWGHAALGVGVWNVIIGVSTIIPVAAFKAAINESPTFIGNNTWQWTYNFEVANVQHAAKLQGTLVNDGVDWKMLLTKAGAYTDYEWYTGHSNSARTEGTWTLNFGPDQNKPFIRIDWTRNVDNTVAGIQYTSIDPDNDGKGSYIHYGITEDTSFNAYYDLFDIKENNLIEIEWNRSDNHGHVKDPKFFGDTDFHCWDSSLEDQVCS